MSSVNFFFAGWTPVVCVIIVGTAMYVTLVVFLRLSGLKKAYINPADELPPPDLDDLREVGIPTVSDEKFAEDLDESEERRRKLRGMVQNDAWEWQSHDQ